MSALSTIITPAVHGRRSAAATPAHRITEITTRQGKTVDKHVATILVIGMLASIWTKDHTKTAPEETAGGHDEIVG
ncbi:MULTISPECIES: hypothetical protein [unclassified Arthrobacter]|uniref:hypothetical protein n=1 Tax=unclassified Arthrobacter TaxID=235627 RepID=UPI0028830656|nr:MULTISPECIES: hypothetical protein [unclassified Arthrobacter]